MFLFRLPVLLVVVLAVVGVGGGGGAAAAGAGDRRSRCRSWPSASLLPSLDRHDCRGRHPEPCLSRPIPWAPVDGCGNYHTKAFKRFKKGRRWQLPALPCRGRTNSVAPGTRLQPLCAASLAMSKHSCIRVLPPVRGVETAPSEIASLNLSRCTVPYMMSRGTQQYLLLFPTRHAESSDTSPRMLPPTVALVGGGANSSQRCDLSGHTDR